MSQESIEKLRNLELHKQFKNGKPLTDEQLEKLSRIFDMGQIGLASGGEGLGMAYLDFCFQNEMNEDELFQQISALHDYIEKTGKSPMSEEQLGYFVDFLNMGWEDVAVAYMNFCKKGRISLELLNDNLKSNND